jgi:sulfate transport system permease protein
MEAARHSFSFTRSGKRSSAQIFLILAAALVLGVLLVLPLAVVFFEALRLGLRLYVEAITAPETLAALRLTALTVALTLPVNILFGLSAGWALGKFRFPGRSLLITFLDLPFAISPVVAGMLFVLLYGRSGLLGPWLSDHGFRVIFAVPGVVLATLFVTLPFVAREVIPLMESTGNDEEEAARVLGAGFWPLFFRVTLPNIKWALLYGALLAAARAVGEFGAVSVVSGHIRGETNTVPLHIEILYNEYQFQPAFAVSSLLTVFALVSLLLHVLLETKRSRGAGMKADR